LLLRDGDMIQVGTQRILFHEKATAKKFDHSPVDGSRAKSTGPLSAPMPAHLCPYCGAPKDPAGNCLCTLGGAPASASSGYNGNVGISPATSAIAPQVNAAPVGYEGSMASYGAAGTLPGVVIGRLVGVEGGTLGQVFALSGPNMVVGREPGKDIVVANDSTVSRTHARIANEYGQVVVYDSGSANGTFINGARIVVQALTPGDIVQFGSSKFRFE